jgi:23S rRNA (guanosine2251-2'-O)-methyltransferase
VEDVHNVGAIIRTAECAGVDAVLIPKRHSAPINETVGKTSAGAIEYVPIVQIGNITQTLRGLQKRGFWVIGADMEGQTDYFHSTLTVPVVLVVGSEGKGISRLVKEACDVLVQIPMFGSINSLNASVAAALLIYEVVRQRQAVT